MVENEAGQKGVQQQFAIDVRPLSDCVIQQVVVVQGAGDQSSAHAQQKQRTGRNWSEDR